MEFDLNSYEHRQAVMHHDHILSFLALANMTASKEILLHLLRKTQGEVRGADLRLVEAAIAVVED